MLKGSDVGYPNAGAILSCRDTSFNGWVAIDEFEDLFSRLNGCEIIAPCSHKRRPGRLGRLTNYFLGEYEAIKNPKLGGDLLLVVARGPGDLNLINAIGMARHNFRYVAGYVLDSYFIEGYSAITKQYDHIFSTTETGADTVRNRFGISSSVLRQGFDCLRWSCTSDPRCIDLIGFGRQPPSFHRLFQSAFHRQESPLLYLHSPIGTVSGRDVWAERPMLLKLLQRSKISLAFHLGVELQHNRPWDAGFVTSRWFESLASGCVVIGKRPPGIMAQEMLNWENSTIEVPDEPLGAVELVKSIAGNDSFLTQVRLRNVIEMRRQHDWRFRIRDIYKHFGLELPKPLLAELSELDGICA